MMSDDGRAIARLMWHACSALVSSADGDDDYAWYLSVLDLYGCSVLYGCTAL